MNCKKCGLEAEKGAKFCVDCGSPLELRCPACQTPYDLGSRFCALCGRVLPEVAVYDQSTQLELPAQQDQSSRSEGLIQSTPPTQPVQPEQPAPPGPQSFACPRCHQSNYPDSEYCFACGMPLEDSSNDFSFHITPDTSPSETLAGFWVRLVAYVIDNILAIVAAGMVVGLFSSPYDIAASLIIFLGIWLGYFTVLIATRATTVGKNFFGLFVVRSDGSRVGLVRAFFRSLTILLILAVAYGTVLGLFLLLIPSVRALHDRICDTKVVSRRGQMS